MARIQFGSIVTGISGKLGGHMFGSSLNGPTIRNKQATKKLWGYIKRGVSGGGQSPQTNVTLISQAWKDLDDNQRAAWSSYAVQYYTTHSLYGVHSLTGYSCFSKLNHNILLVGGSLITVPVPKVTLSDPGAVGIQALSATEFKVSFSGSLNPDEYWLVSATGTNTITLVAQKKGFKIIQYFGSGQASPLNIYDNYVTIKGAPLVGGWITIKLEIINIITGQRGMAKSACLLVS